MISSIVNAVKAFRSIPPPLIIALLGIAALGYAIGTSVTDYQWQARWSERDAADATARAEQEARNREAENAMQHTITGIAQNAEQKLQAAHADVIAADNAADGLRGAISDLQQRLRKSQCTVDSALAGKREAEARAGILLAELLKDSDRRAGEYAAAADDARTRGLACEQAYDAIAGTTNPRK